MAVAEQRVDSDDDALHGVYVVRSFLILTAVSSCPNHGQFNSQKKQKRKVNCHQNYRRQAHAGYG